MNHSTIRSLTTLAITLLVFTLGCQSTQNKIVVGETVSITVVDAGMTYESRVDTGAATTSLHAVDIQIDDESEKPQNNRGKTISFTTRDQQGNEKRMTTTITRVAQVKNSQGTEYRYVVELELQYKDKKALKEVNLRDRTAMKYKMLIGRNCLTNALVEIGQE